MSRSQPAVGSQGTHGGGGGEGVRARRQPVAGARRGAQRRHHCNTRSCTAGRVSRARGGVCVCVWGGMCVYAPAGGAARRAACCSAARARAAPAALRNQQPHYLHARAPPTDTTTLHSATKTTFTFSTPNISNRLQKLGSQFLLLQTEGTNLPSF